MREVRPTAALPHARRTSKYKSIFTATERRIKAYDEDEDDSTSRAADDNTDLQTQSTDLAWCIMQQPRHGLSYTLNARKYQGSMSTSCLGILIASEWQLSLDTALHCTPRCRSVKRPMTPLLTLARCRTSSASARVFSEPPTCSTSNPRPVLRLSKSEALSCTTVESRILHHPVTEFLCMETAPGGS